MQTGRLELLRIPEAKWTRARRPRASGKHVGWPRVVLNRLRIDQLRGEGLSCREVARRMDLPRSTVYRSATV